jgi:hypothetical protein
MIDCHGPFKREQTALGARGRGALVAAAAVVGAGAVDKPIQRREPLDLVLLRELVLHRRVHLREHHVGPALGELERGGRVLGRERLQGMAAVFEDKHSAHAGRKGGVQDIKLIHLSGSSKDRYRDLRLHSCTKRDRPGEGREVRGAGFLTLQ